MVEESIGENMCSYVRAVPSADQRDASVTGVVCQCSLGDGVEVDADHRLDILGIAQEHVVQAVTLDIGLGPRVVNLLDTWHNGITSVVACGVSDMNTIRWQGSVDGLL